MQNKFRFVMLLVAFVCCVCGVWAVPARRVAITVEQPDGTQLTLTMQGDEHFHCLVTADGVPVVRHEGAYYYARIGENSIEASGLLAHELDLRTVEERDFVMSLPDMKQARAKRVMRANARRSATAGTSVEVPVMGEVRVPILLVQYADVKFSSVDPKSTFEKRANGENYTDEGGHGSIREYYLDQSDGQFSPHFDIIGPVTLSHEMKYYGGNDKVGGDLRPREMVSEACRIAYSDNLADFTLYDNNDDGYVDIMYVIYAGYGEASYPDKLEDTIWPHQWQLESPLSLGGVRVSRYACNNELDGHSGTELDGIGTFCHEFSHCLGLPDFYDTSDGSAMGMDRWSIMDYGCYNNNGHTPCGYTGYEKDCLGWQSLVELRNPANITLTPLNEGGAAYKVVNEANPNEFYVLEYKKQAGWDAYAPAEGMLVTHVDYLASAWANNVINTDPNHPRMTVIPADGTFTGQTLAGDVYPGSSGNNQLTATSSPAAKVYTGEYMNKDITNISKQEGVVTFSFMKGALPAPRMYEPDSIAPSGFSVSWEAVDSVEEYELRLDRLEENPYLIDEDFGKVKKGYADIGPTLDAYTKQSGWNGRDIYGLDGAIRLGGTSTGGVLLSPELVCDSATFTVIFTIRKSNPSGNDAYMVMAVGDAAWEGLYGYGLTIDDEEWGTYFLVMDTIGSNSFFYIDTRDNTETDEAEAIRVDLDDLYLLPGDRTEELVGEDEPSDSSQQSRAIRPVKALARKQYMGQPMEAVLGMVEQAKNEEVTDSTSDSGQDSPRTIRYDEVPIYTTRVKGNAFTFEDLDGGLYRCRVRSMRDSVVSHYSNAVEVLLTDTLLPQVDTIPHIYIHQDSMYMQIPDSIDVYYTVDGQRPSAYSTRYTAPFALGQKKTVYAIARRKGYRSSEVIREDNWFRLDGATYRVLSTVEPEVLLSEAVDGNGKSDYAGHIVLGDVVQRDTVAYALSGIESHAFRDAIALRSVVLEGSALRSVGDSLFHGCTALNAVVWDVDVPVKDNLFDGQSYNNLLLYLPDTAHLANPLIEAKRMTVVKDGKSGELQLHADNAFYCPRPFVAGQVSYKRNFSQYTGLESSAGWETIVLPFDVQRTTHAAKGEIVPFGTVATSHNQYWLAEADGAAFKAASAIKANVPYIIAMPNNAAYGEHSLNGQITFSAEEAMIYATDEGMVGQLGDFTLVPTYEKLDADKGIYALNVGSKHESYSSGSVFVAGKYAVRPFSAYVVPVQEEEAAPMYRITFSEGDTAEEAEPLSMSVKARGGVVYITVPEDRWVEVYDMTGRRVRTVYCKAGVNEVNSLAAGMYVVETTKVYVDR